MSRQDIAINAPILKYDRGNKELSGAGPTERAAVLALQAGFRLSQSFGHRGYSIGCKAVSIVAPDRDILVRLNRDAVFAIPLGRSVLEQTPQ